MVLPSTQRKVDWRNSQLHWQFANCPPGAPSLSLVSCVIDGRCVTLRTTNQIVVFSSFRRTTKSHKIITPCLIINYTIFSPLHSQRMKLTVSWHKTSRCFVPAFMLWGSHGRENGSTVACSLVDTPYVSEKRVASDIRIIDVSSTVHETLEICLLTALCRITKPGMRLCFCFSIHRTFRSSKYSTGARFKSLQLVTLADVLRDFPQPLDKCRSKTSLGHNHYFPRFF
jgi:hypothetical protein